MIHLKKKSRVKNLIMVTLECNWFVLIDILLANCDEPNLILPKFARHLFFFLISFLALTEINIVR